MENKTKKYTELKAAFDAAFEREYGALTKAESHDLMNHVHALALSRLNTSAEKNIRQYIMTDGEKLYAARLLADIETSQLMAVNYCFTLEQICSRVGTGAVEIDGYGTIINNERSITDGLRNKNN